MRTAKQPEILPSEICDYGDNHIGCRSFVQVSDDRDGIRNEFEYPEPWIQDVECGQESAGNNEVSFHVGSRYNFGARAGGNSLSLRR